jgi:hypothetical protein
MPDVSAGVLVVAAAAAVHRWRLRRRTQDLRKEAVEILVGSQQGSCLFRPRWSVEGRIHKPAQEVEAHAHGAEHGVRAIAHTLNALLREITAA